MSNAVVVSNALGTIGLRRAPKSGVITYAPPISDARVEETSCESSSCTNRCSVTPRPSPGQSGLPEDRNPRSIPQAMVVAVLSGGWGRPIRIDLPVGAGRSGRSGVQRPLSRWPVPADRRPTAMVLPTHGLRAAADRRVSSLPPGAELETTPPAARLRRPLPVQ